MVLEVIYVTRHGFRSNWVVDPQTGVYSTNIKSPTNIPSDPALAGYGVAQSRQLADHIFNLEPPVERIYSSPFYRCLQTIAPAVEKLGAAGKQVGDVCVENGLGEWYGKARFSHPSPAAPKVLKGFFPWHSSTYEPVIIPSVNGETISQLHDRVAFALASIIQKIDEEDNGPKAILICTHAATLIAIGRALTGNMPEKVEEEDFKPFTCSLSKFLRRKVRQTDFSGENVTSLPDPEVIPQVGWKQGHGVGGGWNCVLNGDCSFLDGGEERGWRFSGDESFSMSTQPDRGGLGLDAGNELGVVVQGRKSNCSGERNSRI